MKRVLLSILIIAMTLSLVACSSKRESEDIVIGEYMPLTGSIAGAGTCMVRGVQMAFDEINEAGGINGRKLALKTYDSTGTTEGATKAATRLIENDGVNVIAGSNLSASILAVSSLTERAKVLHVGGGTGSTWTGIGLEYTYRCTANGIYPVATMVDEIADFGYKSIALISVESEYGQSGHDAVLQNCKDKGIEVLADVKYQSADTDFSGVISKALKSEADTVVMYGLGVELAMITKQIRQNGYNGLLFTAESGGAYEMFDVAGNASNGVVFAATYVVPNTVEESATTEIKRVVQKYLDQYKEMPHDNEFFRGYDQGRLIVQALLTCEDVDDGESIMKAFKNIKGIELLGGTFDFTNGTGDGLDQTNKWMILDGKVQVYDKVKLESWLNK